MTIEQQRGEGRAARPETSPITTEGRPLMGTWTFFGHWDGSRLVIDFVTEGDVTDTRVQNDDEFPEGLWADSATAETREAALQELIDTYEPQYENEPDDAAERSRAADLLRNR